MSISDPPTPEVGAQSLTKQVFEKTQNVYDHAIESEMFSQNGPPFANTLQRLVEMSGTDCKLKAGGDSLPRKQYG